MRGGPPDRSVVTFNYDKSEAKSVAERLLAGAECVYLQTDGYVGYDAICTTKGIIQLGCWDHARRKFIEAINAAPKRDKKTKSKKPCKTEVAIAKIGALYAVESKMDKLDDDDERKRIERNTAYPNSMRYTSG